MAFDVNFIIDEAAAFGYSEHFSNMLNLGREAHIKLMFIYQSFGQLKSCWPEGNELTLLSNCSLTVFGVNDNATADYVSANLGDETIIVNSGGTSRGTSRTYSYAQSQNSVSYSTNSNDNWSPTGRHLMQPAEILRMDKDLAITLHAGKPPIVTRRCRHYKKDYRQSRIKEFLSAFLILSLSLVLFVTSALVAVKVRHEMEVHKNEQGLGGSIGPNRQGSGQGM